MIYRDFGTTGIKISTLGFGCMRFPMVEINGQMEVDQDLADAMVKRAYELGINYFDTALFYLKEKGEISLGKAVKGFRDKIYISTKVAADGLKKYGGYRKALEIELKRLDVDYIDFHHFHGFNNERLLQNDADYNVIAEATKAKEEGLIKHLSFSFHGDPESMKKNIDTGLFSSVLCQYNIIDRRNEEAIAYAKEKGVGVVIMGPLCGGKIAHFPATVAKEVGLDAKTSAEMGLKFVLSNPNVSCALSGMTSVEMVEENVATVSNFTELSAEEKTKINGLIEEKKKIADLYCTSCKYCMPCPQGVIIEWIFDIYSGYQVYGAKDWAFEEYRELLRRHPDGGATSCIKCGICETKCPQGIKIMDQLEAAHEVLKEALV
jgi:predicted aldo/keto reductase-like oxidoreductase